MVDRCGVSLGGSPKWASTSGWRRGVVAIQRRRPRQLEMPQQIHQRREALLAKGLDVHAGIIEEARAGAHADAALFHVARNHLRCAIAVAVQSAFEIAAGVIENVAAAP